MLGVLISIMVVAIVGLIPIMFSKQSYGSELEQYITSRNPSSTYDVEKFTREFDESRKQGIV